MLVKHRFADAARKILNDFSDRMGWFDDAPPGICCRNGFLCGEKGLKLVPFSPDHRATQAVGWEYGQDRTTPLFDRCAAVWFNGCDDREARIDCLLEYVGLALLSRGTQFHKALVLLGEGANGKSAFLKIVDGLFEGQVAAIPPQLWQDQYRRSLLAGVLINLVNELPESDVLHTETFKAIISGDRVDARPIYKEPFSFFAKAGHIFAANSLPHIRDTSWGAWRRLVILEFPHKIPKKKQEPQLAERIIAAEGTALFSRCVQAGALALSRGSLTEPPSSAEHLEQWKIASNSVHCFIAEMCVTCDDGTRAKQLYALYKIWIERNGLRQISSNRFGRRLKCLGIEKSERADGTYWHLRLTEPSALC